MKCVWSTEPFCFLCNIWLKKTQNILHSWLLNPLYVVTLEEFKTLEQYPSYLLKLVKNFFSFFNRARIGFIVVDLVHLLHWFFKKTKWLQIQALFKKAITAIIEQNTLGNPFFKILKENHIKKPHNNLTYSNLKCRSYNYYYFNFLNIIICTMNSFWSCLSTFSATGLFSSSKSR